jgi:membrane-associated phospholipid phosphatase
MRGMAALAALTLVCPTGAWAKSTTEKIGDAGQIVLPAAGLVAAALHKDGKGALELVEAFGSTMIVVYVLKVSVDRTRPNGGGQSFPSGHTASAFSGAAFLQQRYGWAYGVPAYLAAAFVGYSRVESRNHWTSDVLAGGALGIAGNLVFTRRYHNVVLTPVLGPHSVGIAISATW